MCGSSGTVPLEAVLAISFGSTRGEIASGAKQPAECQRCQKNGNQPGWLRHGLGIGAYLFECGHDAEVAVVIEHGPDAVGRRVDPFGAEQRRELHALEIARIRSGRKQSGIARELIILDELREASLKFRGIGVGAWAAEIPQHGALPLRQAGR